MNCEFDAIIVGSGIAGLSFALKIAEKGYNVAILTKKTRVDSNTNYAQGGIACVTSNTDDFESHLKDTLEAGDGLCREEVVREIVRDGPARINELIEQGLKFSQDESGKFDLGREGGHSRRRILHVKDMTGKAIEDSLIRAVEKSPRIQMMEHFFVIDLLTSRKLGKCEEESENKVLGLYALDVQSQEVKTFRAPSVVLSTGGASQVYLYTTNPDIATGDGVAIAYRAGVAVENMEFIQFHPTTLYSTTGERFLISEAVRGEGAVLRDLKGDTFMEGYHPQADLAPRDVVARAIDAEMKESGAPHLWLDITSKDEAFLKDRFPAIYTTCKKLGIDISKEYIPVVPAAHYACGGVITNIRAETSLKGLYACGEVSSTGLHGANRLASNSLLEAVVMANKGAEAVRDYLSNAEACEVELPSWVDGGVHDSDEQVVLSHNWDELRRTMWDYVGIVRTTKRLERARTRILNLSREIQDYYWNFAVEPRLLELRNLIQVAKLIVECALMRKESRGLHYTLDYPNHSEEKMDTQSRGSSD
jgi:L-aspartate oxidase